jgi:hypothetical protein
LPRLNLPPECRVVKITSRALFLNFGIMSTGMPRPLSSTVTVLPSAWSVTSTRVACLLMTSSMELSTTSQRRWW